MPRILAALAACTLAMGAQAETFRTVATVEGVARVVNGDGLRIGPVEVRLNGIAAPEDGAHAVDPGGPEATAALRDLAGGRHVVCRIDGTTTRGRAVGRCAVGDLDLGGALVRGGWARDCPRFSGGDYAAAEAAARAAGRDLAAIYALPEYCGRG